MSHGTFCFMSFHGYGYYLSSTAALLYCSYFTHNIVAWLKIRPFFRGPQSFFSPPYSTWIARIYLTTLALTIPVYIFEIFNNFRFFNNLSRLYAKVRPYEPLFRDPWWLFSCATLLHVIKRSYGLKIVGLCKKSPRFAIMLVAIFLAVVFTLVDILSTIVGGLGVVDGSVRVQLNIFDGNLKIVLTVLRINPYWKLALVFKCLTDNILLDDFKSVLQRLGAMKLDGTNITAPYPDAEDSQFNDKHAITEHHEGGLNFITGPSITSNEGANPDKIEFVDMLNDSPGLRAENSKRNSASASTNGIGKFGVKIQDLPGLPYSPRKELKVTKES